MIGAYQTAVGDSKTSYWTSCAKQFSYSHDISPVWSLASVLIVIRLSIDQTVCSQVAQIAEGCYMTVLWVYAAVSHAAC